MSNAYTLYECDFGDADIDGKKLTGPQLIIKVVELLFDHSQGKPSKKRRLSDENVQGKTSDLWRYHAHHTGQEAQLYLL